MAAPASLWLNSNQEQDNHVLHTEQQNNSFVPQQCIDSEDRHPKNDRCQTASTHDARHNGRRQRKQEYRPIQKCTQTVDQTNTSSRSTSSKKKNKKDKCQANRLSTDRKFSVNAKVFVPTPKVEDQEKTRDCCVVCANKIDFHAVGECNHHGICSKCFMRMRGVMNDRSCPICKKILSKMIVSREIQPFESFSTWGEEFLGAGNAVDAKTDMIFVNCRAHYQSLKRLLDFYCRVRSCHHSTQPFLNIDQLNLHMKEEHDLMFCQLCLAHETQFIQEYPVYTKSKLAAHNLGRNGRTKLRQKKGKDLHPMCQFCKQRHYSDIQLFQHLEKDHYKCHLCHSADQYYRDYTSLEKHFRSQHHLCEDSKCLASRYVVFGNQIDYHAHMAQIHGIRNPKVMLDFHVTRCTAQPQASNDNSTPEMWVPNEGERRQGIEFMMTELEESFPSLPVPSRNESNVSLIRTSPSIDSSTPTRSRTNREKISMDVLADRQGQIARNRSLAQAFGLSRPGIYDEEFALELIGPLYSQELIEWAKTNTGYLSTIERRLERLVKETRCFNASLKPMPSEERACMHELATIYGVNSESTGQDPYRRVVFYKRDNAKVPIISLSTHLDALRREATLANRPANQSQNLTEERPANHGENRGWERPSCEDQKIIVDAWSDDEEKVDEVCTDTS
uniref:Uncharacterized protein AlNc14C166G7881 n=1 Tax=Albugo laibachii Nc14 TaxID=890382 RepID=F0WN48_9STRA|nr:conserved hypothetical protein [Albugo laibachii Nc14]|eukprot:CCA22737.1 conserved hypothetical protein [Albugo laibachii Nc14]